MTLQGHPLDTPVEGDPATYHRGDAGTLDVAEASNIRRFFDYWRDLRRGRSMPARGDINPLDIPWALPRLYLGDYDPSGPSFIYRVAGDEIAEIFRHFTGSTNMRGMRLGDGMSEESAQALIRRWRPVGAHGEIVLMKGLIYFTIDRIHVGERLILPLSEDGARVTGFFGYTTCHWVATADTYEDVNLDVWYIPHDAIPATV